MQYWINNNGVQAGPVSLDELKNMQITPDTYVWRSGMDDWEKIGDVPELRDMLAGKAPLIEPVPEITPEPEVVAPEPVETLEEPDIEVEFLEDDDDVTVAGDFSDDEDEQYPSYAEIQTPAAAVYSGPEQAPAAGFPGQQYAAAQPVTPPCDEECPPTNLVWGIITTVLCCSLVGLIAIVLSVMVKPAYNRGDLAKAKRLSEWSAWLCIASIILGLISAPIYMAFSSLSMMP